MTTETYDDRDVIGIAMKLVGAGDGLSQAVKLKKGDVPDYHLGDRTVVVHEVELVKVELVPAVKDDLHGPLTKVLTFRALDGTPTDSAAVRKLLEQHKKQLAKAREIEGQQDLLEEEEAAAAAEAAARDEDGDD